MKNFILIFTSIILCLDSAFSQDFDNAKIFLLIVENNISENGILISCEQNQIVFNGDNFNQQTGLEVPLNILKELEISSKTEHEGSWNTIFPIKNNFGLYSLGSNECLNENEIATLMNNSKEINKIYFISSPIYDINQENCVISFSCNMFKGSTYGHSYFLKKVYGSWTIIAIFDLWIS